MKTVTMLHRCGGLLAVVLLLARVTTYAQASPDEPAAVLVYPYIAVDPAGGTDTLIQLSNTSDSPVDLRCFYEDFTPQCFNGQPGESCFPGSDTCTGFCAPHPVRIPLRVRATPQQPLAWAVSAGLQELPLAGNESTEVPGVGMRAFMGTLRCVVTSNATDRSQDNVLVGQATIERSGGAPPPYADAAQYRAMGIKALPTGASRDESLNLGGPDAGYEACPAFGLVDHFFDGAPVETGQGTANVSTTLALANCSASLPVAPDNVVQFEVVNEFAQRFTTSRVVHGQLVAPLSMLDQSQPERSIFGYQVSGTLTGRTLIHGTISGLYVVAIESRRSQSVPDRMQSDALDALGVDARPEGDVLDLRPSRCAGDCNFDGGVTIDELIQGVNIALGILPTDACAAMDANGDFAVTMDEIISAVNVALDGCPPPPVPTPALTPSPTPTVSVPTSAGPEITHLGVATADDRPLSPDSADEMGRPVFVRPFGQGMTLVIEARRGQSGSAVGRSTYSATGGLPDLQVLVSRPLGNGDPAVCEENGRAGGIPAVPSLDFTPEPATVAAINDLGCRTFNQPSQPPSPCTRNASPVTLQTPFSTVSPLSEVQFCLPIAKAWAFPVGDTVVAARVRDDAGNLGPALEIVVRVAE